jgi:lysophospholipase L1-like esterase
MRRIMLRILTAGFVLSALAMPSLAATNADAHWVDAWSAPPDQAGPPFAAQTVRQVIQTSIGGTRVRIRLSNLFGTAPVTIGPVHIATHAKGATVEAGTDHVVTFGGKTAVIIAKGLDVLSDPVMMPVVAMQQLAVSMYFPKRTGASTIHGLANQSAYVTPSGDATATESFPDSDIATSRFFITDLEVASTAGTRALVAVGDSITDGAGSTPEENRRWTDALVARLQADPTRPSIAVINAGIAGNRILRDGGISFIGPATLARFDRDALDKPGVAWVFLAQGINDIAAANTLASPRDNVSAQQIIKGMKSLIARAHKKGYKIIGATLLPCGGAGWPFHTPAGEAKRLEVNKWIREGSAFDAVVDFDQLVRDPARTDHLQAAFDSGDGIHPNDAGYKAMAALVDLHVLGAK